MQYTKKQLKAAQTNKQIKMDCPPWMQKLFENCPSEFTLLMYGGDESDKKLDKKLFTDDHYTGDWSGGIYRIQKKDVKVEHPDKHMNPVIRWALVDKATNDMFPVTYSTRKIARKNKDTYERVVKVIIRQVPD